MSGWQLWLLLAMNAVTVVCLGLTIHWNRQAEKYARRSLAAHERIKAAHDRMESLRR